MNEETKAAENAVPQTDAAETHTAAGAENERRRTMQNSETVPAGAEALRQTADARNGEAAAQNGTAAMNANSDAARPSAAGTEATASAETEADAAQAALPGLTDAMIREVREELRLRSHFDDLTAQASALREQYPGLKLADELQNPLFFRLTTPEVGLSVEDAYWLVHRRELTEQAAAQAAKDSETKLANAVQAGKTRPQEGSGAGGAVTHFDYAAMTPKQRREFLDYARRASERGEKVYLA